MMSAVGPDAHKIALKIIEAIRQHPVLYISDVKGSAIKLQEFRQKVWKRISDELGLEPGWVRLRWKNLRDTYCRILKQKGPKGPKGKSEKGARRKKWIFEDHLSFLKFPYEPDYQPQCVELSDEYIKDINSGMISTEDLLDQLENHNDEDDYSEYLEVLEETLADPVLPSPPSPSPLPAPTTQVENTNSSSTIDAYVHQIQSKYRKIQPKTPRIDPELSDDLDESNDYGILSPHFKIEHLGLPLTGRVTTKATERVPPPAAAPSTSRSSTVVSSAPERPTRSTRPVSPAPMPSPTPQSLPPPREPSPPPENSEDTLKHDNFLAPVEKTSVELFFSSMARTVKALPLKAQAEIKMSVCKIVTEAEVKHSKRNLNLENTQQFIAPPGMIPKLVLIPCSMIDRPTKK